ncbi:hypothetical protein [Micromonospora tarensis]|uniref:Uncharacterized protein n=1 Tax=Micromonospora tarensis TaxID=2806100 RepID=A0ABS1YAV3_9ACTN|nr:hypothetical protein [Micromonospora tarensis]MBM0274502.1 hypothetical protein [Micromonospora tarensis]
MPERCSVAVAVGDVAQVGEKLDGGVVVAGFLGGDEVVDLLPHAGLADGEGVESSWRVAVTDQLPATGFDVGEVERRNRNLTRLGDAVGVVKTHNMVLDTTAPAGASSPLATAADIAGTGDRAHGHLRLSTARERHHQG